MIIHGMSDQWTVCWDGGGGGPLRGSLSLRKGHLSCGRGGQHHAYLARVGIGLWMEVCDKPHCRVSTGSSGYESSHWCTFILTCLNLPLWQFQENPPCVWSIFRYLESDYKIYSWIPFASAFFFPPLILAMSHLIPFPVDPCQQYFLYQPHLAVGISLPASKICRFRVNLEKKHLFVSFIAAGMGEPNSQDVIMFKINRHFQGNLDKQWHCDNALSPAVGDVRGTGRYCTVWSTVWAWAERNLLISECNLYLSICHCESPLGYILFFRTVVQEVSSILLFSHREMFSF